MSILVSRQSLVIRMVTERTKWGAWSLTYDAILILHAAPLLRAELMRSPRVQFDTSQVHLRRLKFDYGT